jgi:methylenetetrahydrofolate reductase (NADPH)
MPAMSGRAQHPPADNEGERSAIAALARDASVEMTWHDVPLLPDCRSRLARGTSVFVSHLPGQTWEQTVETCEAVRAHGFDPVPHIPARQLQNPDVLDRLASELALRAEVREALIIAGDAPCPLGPFATTQEVLATGALPAHGIRHIAVAGHPEGHPGIADEELRRAERDKVAFAASHALEIVFLTQFFFEAAPFVAWVRGLRANGVRARILAGLAGPARIATLFRYAVRCGVGPSARALGERTDAFARLVGERGPETIVRSVTRAASAGALGDVGIHLYSFGGLTRTCRWLRATADGRFTLDNSGGFRVDDAALG